MKHLFAALVRKGLAETDVPQVWSSLLCTGGCQPERKVKLFALILVVFLALSGNCARARRVHPWDAGRSDRTLIG